MVCFDTPQVHNWMGVTEGFEQIPERQAGSRENNLVCFNALIFTGQSHISKVVVFSQVSNISTLPFILAKYFI